MPSATILLSYLFLVPTMSGLALFSECEAMSDILAIRGRCKYLTFLPCITRLVDVRRQLRFLLIPRTPNGSQVVVMLPVFFWYSAKTDTEVNEPMCQCAVGKFDLGADIQFGQV